MFTIRSSIVFRVALLACAVFLPSRELAAEAPVSAAPDFTREVRPILSRYCFKCHGPDDKTRKAKLRLDVRESAVKEAIVPGKPDDSEFVNRLFTKDAEEIMPPPAQKMELTDAQKDVLKRWVAAGAEYQPHWAFVKPVSPPLPDVAAALRAAPSASRSDAATKLDAAALQAWPRNGIDYFTLDRMLREGLAPSPQADKYALIRRVSLDLIGLPPTLEEIDAFVNDTSPNAYEKVIDRLLASPQYGERWARRWLDLARYADTNGYEKDRPRSIWLYREWVIHALNADMPFDEFTIQQIAGDMVDEEGTKGQRDEGTKGRIGATSHSSVPQSRSPSFPSSLSARIATGFHRNTMLNEEGGIDPLEFRFHAMNDRVSTTGTTWLGLTVGCAQCHTHKYDPIPHQEYYQLFASLNNADEPMLDVPTPEVAAKRAEIEKKIAELESSLAERFPIETKVDWSIAKPVAATSTGGATLIIAGDGSITAGGATPESDTYTVTFDVPAGAGKGREISRLRLEALVDASDASKGPGRTPHGNFVVTEVTASVQPLDDAGEPKPAPKKGKPQPRAVKFITASADAAQKDFPAAAMIDGNDKTGWAIHDAASPNWRTNRAAEFTLATPESTKSAQRWTVAIQQNYGKQHTLHRLRLSLGTSQDEQPGAVAGDKRHDVMMKRFAEWLKVEEAKAERWTLLKPSAMTSNLPLLTLESDGSIFVTGDQTKSDTYELTFDAASLPKGVTAIRIEAMPDDRLPKHGPGRVYYEGPIGDFTLCNLTLDAEGARQRFAGGNASFASGGFTADKALDADMQTGWSISGGQGKRHVAVYALAQPTPDGKTLTLKMLFERHYAAGLGRFRVWATTQPGLTAARNVPVDVEQALATPAAQRTNAQNDALLKQFLSVAPELTGVRAQIEQLRQSMPAYVTTLVMRERPSDPRSVRPTHLHHRGEFLQPKDLVEPGVLTALNAPLPAGVAANRLTFAKWLVSEDNPLAARVTMNRQWHAFFGRGIVKTLDDFGLQGEAPTHPALLDWLAVEFTNARPLAPGSAGGRPAVTGGVSLTSSSPNPPAEPGAKGESAAPPAEPGANGAWSLKKMHKLIVMSATYQQSSNVTSELLKRDPENKLLARGPRHRLEGEIIRDSALKAAGLLSPKLGGPSVFPPQPANITTEGAYGQLAWNVSTGEDRYRRSLYTFAKRTAPFALLTTFDAGSGEACIARRDMSNTALQALSLLNDVTFNESAQAIGKLLAARQGTTEDKVRELYLRILSRPPAAEETKDLAAFFTAQKQRLEKKELDAKTIAGDGPGDVNERAAWTALARVVLNLDEVVTK